MAKGLEPIVDNAPYLTHHHAGMTIEGYSRAAVQSYWRIPELKIGFDLGAQPWDFMGTPTWLLTHTHLDHVAALPVYVARRRMMKMEPPQIYLPEEAVEDVQRLLLDHATARPRPHALPAHGRHGRPGDRAVARARGHRVRARRTRFRRVGYLVWDRRHKLKEEYLGLPGDKIRDLRLSGMEVTREVRTPLFATPATPARPASTPIRPRSRPRS